MRSVNSDQNMVNKCYTSLGCSFNGGNGWREGRDDGKYMKWFGFACRDVV